MICRSGKEVKQSRGCLTVVESSFCSQRMLIWTLSIDRYFEKDVVEKSFFVMKHLEHLQPIRYHLENRVYANVFMSYPGLLLYSVLKSKLKGALEAALEELAKEIEFTDESGMNNHELTRKQKAIIKSPGSLFSL